jgi:hypothetical protein
MEVINHEDRGFERSVATSAIEEARNIVLDGKVPSAHVEIVRVGIPRQFFEHLVDNASLADSGRPFDKEVSAWLQDVCLHLPIVRWFHIGVGGQPHGLEDVLK